MIMNRMPGGEKNTLQVADIITTTRTLTGSDYKLCDGSKIPNPPLTMQQTAFNNMELALSANSGTISANPSGHFFDGTYLLEHELASSSSYPTIYTYKRDSNGGLTYVGAKTISIAAGGHSQSKHTSIYYIGWIVKCGGYYYFPFVKTSDGTLSIAYTSNPEGSWSYRDVDTSAIGTTVYKRYPCLYTNDSVVRLDFLNSYTSPYKIHTYQFSGDVSNISYIGETASYAYRSYAEAALENGIRRVGDYYYSVYSIGTTDKYYKTFTGNWVHIDNGSSGLYTNTSQQAYYGAGYYWIINRHGSSTSDFEWCVRFGTSWPNLMNQTGFSTIYLPHDDYSSSTFPTGTTPGNSGAGAFFHNSKFWIPAMQSYKIILYGINPSNSTYERYEFDYTSRSAYAVLPNNPNILGEWAIRHVNGSPGYYTLFGPAVPNLSVSGRNSYMRLG